MRIRDTCMCEIRQCQGVTLGHRCEAVRAFLGFWGDRGVVARSLLCISLVLPCLPWSRVVMDVVHKN